MDTRAGFEEDSKGTFSAAQIASLFQARQSGGSDQLLILTDLVSEWHLFQRENIFQKFVTKSTALSCFN